MQNFQTKSARLVVVCLLVFTLLVSTACSLGGLSIGKDSATLDVTLTEAQLNPLLAKSDIVSQNNPDRLIDRITKVEMHDGFMRIFGDGKDPSGNPVSGSFDTQFGVENDVLVVKIIAVDMPGVDINDERILKANQVIASELEKSVRESNGDVQYQEASVTEDGLKLKIKVDFNK